MPNDYFQFRQFRINQAHCAQKVSTDACLLGAAADLTGATRILDIGTGTGLLALMAAQRAPGAQVEAVELDPAAAAQAAANVAASPWAGRVRVHTQALADYRPAAPLAGADLRFSHILCNPPFFQRSLRPPGAARAAARHAGAASLTFAEIAEFAARHLLPLGRLAVLLPPLARLAVRHQPDGRITRAIWEFGPGPAGPVAGRELTITDATGAYSTEFRQLLGPFYLQLGG